MPLSVWLYSALVVCSIPIAFFALNSDNKVSAKAIKNLGSRSSDLRVIRLEQPPLERIALPVLRVMGNSFRRFMPTEWINRYEVNLGEAGRLGRWTAEQVIGAKVALTAFAGVWAALRILGGLTGSGFAMTVLVVLIAFFLPDLVISSMAARRKEEIELELPDVLDQLTMSVEAGLAFEAAMGRIAARGDGVMAQEFGRLIQDIKLGTPRSEALTALGLRSGVDDLRHVVLSLKQAEKLGVPLAQTLRTISDQMRVKRAFRAEEKAHKLPVKMIFPLGMCILPALFIVLLGPAAIQLSEVF